jgi:ribonuclease BN (tRNA processing enzyme)
MTSQIRRTIMCDSQEVTTTSCCVPSLTPALSAAPAGHGGMSRRAALGTLGASATALTAASLLAGEGTARAASSSPAATADATGLSVTLLGTNGGPPPLNARFGISSALTVNGKTYVIDCGRGALSQFVRAGLALPSLAGIFLTHLHSDHTVDYFSFPLLSATTGAFTSTEVYGPGPAGEQSLAPTAPGPVPGIAGLTLLANQAFAASTTFFKAENVGKDPVSLVNVHEVMPPASARASLAAPAPVMSPFTVFEDSDVKVSAVLVPHGAVFPAYAYRFDTDHGSVVFSGDTAPNPNIITLARHADLLVHEAVSLATYEGLGLPPALLAHLQAVHTDVTVLGQIAANAGVRALVASHLGPGDPTILSDAAWRKALRDSARAAHFHGPVILGQDLMKIPVCKK